jgi:hypothetical protein
MKNIFSEFRPLWSKTGFPKNREIYFAETIFVYTILDILKMSKIGKSYFLILKKI